MSKKDYIDACNEIEVSETLKKDTYKKITNATSKKVYNKIYPIASLALAFTIIIAIVLPNKTIEKVENIAKDTEVQEGVVLPKIENFENLYAMLKKNNGNSYNGWIKDELVEDFTTAENSLNAANSKKYSETNTQVEGVDEDDIVKTDGNYIYYRRANSVSIVDAKEMKVVSNIEFEKNFYSSSIYLDGNKLIVIGSRYNNDDVVYNSPLIEYDVAYTYPTSNSYYTTAIVYDIANRKAPKEERRVEIEGNYLSSRMIGDTLYLVSNKYIYSYICWNYAIDELNENDFKPKYVDTINNNEVKYLEFNDICYFPESEDTSYLNIASFNVNDKKEACIQSFLGAGNELYASTKSLYVTNIKYDYNAILGKTDINTEIYKFKLDNEKCVFESSGEVAGTMLNQFSMDEKDGYFRVATTDHTILGNTANNLYVLNDKLEIVGELKGLAKGEKIYSVRFMGDRAYIVTFVQTDPLFVIDLSEPTNPKVLGELIIPGYSTYLHPYDETHIIGFGEDTATTKNRYGTVTTTEGMKMALFDVSDPNNPIEMYSENIGQRGTTSELLYNHKALLYSKEKNIIAFPIVIRENNYKETFQGAIVYGLSLEKGFELKGKITSAEYKNYSDKVRRIIYIDDTFYTLGDNTIKATDMNTMKEIGIIDLINI